MLDVKHLMIVPSIAAAVVKFGVTVAPKERALGREAAHHQGAEALTLKRVPQVRSRLVAGGDRRRGYPERASMTNVF